MKILKLSFIALFLSTLFLSSCTDESEIISTDTIQKHDNLYDNLNESKNRIRTYNEWKTIQFETQNKLGELSTTEDFMQSKYLVNYFNGDKKQLAVFIQALKSDKTAESYTLEDLVNFDHFSESSAEYINNFLLDLELLNGDNKNEVFDYIDSQFDPKFLVSRFDIEMTTKLIQYSYYFRFELEKYFNSETRSMGCNWLEAIETIS